MKTTSILLVDDEEMIIASIGWALEKHGFCVTTAGSGQKAIECLRRQRYDVVVTDLMMAGIDGLQVLTQTKKLYPETSVLILTGYGDIDSAVQAMQKGAADYLLKPCDIEELLRKIDRNLERQDMILQLQGRNEQLMAEIEARQRVEQQLAQSRDQLETQVEQRTAELRASLQEMQQIMNILLDRERELRDKNTELEELNGTLRTMLRRWEKEQAELRSELAAKMTDTVLPMLDKALLKASGTTREYIKAAKLYLLEFRTKQIPDKLIPTTAFSPRELQIIHFIKQDRSSKEIADFLNLSIRTVESYRENIRKKLNITKSKKSLRKFILSLP